MGVPGALLRRHRNAVDDERHAQLVAGAVGAKPDREVLDRLVERPEHGVAVPEDDEVADALRVEAESRRRLVARQDVLDARELPERGVDPRPWAIPARRRWCATLTRALRLCDAGAGR